MIESDPEDKSLVVAHYIQGEKNGICFAIERSDVRVDSNYIDDKCEGVREFTESDGTIMKIVNYFR